MVGMYDDAVGACRWYHRRQEQLCDQVTPWAHGTVFRATRYPTYRDYNAVCVTGDPPLSAVALSALADEALAGLGHRRLDFDRVQVGERLHADLEALGWEAETLVCMHHDGSLSVRGDRWAGEVAYEYAQPLREAWDREDHPDSAGSEARARFHRDAREVAKRLGIRVLVIRDEVTDAPVGFAEIAFDGRSAEIFSVYVDPAHRSRGLGTALTRAAIHAAGDADDLWIVADDAGRPKELYTRAGFRAVWRTVLFARVVEPG